MTLLKSQVAQEEIEKRARQELLELVLKSPNSPGADDLFKTSQLDDLGAAYQVDPQWTAPALTYEDVVREAETLREELPTITTLDELADVERRVADVEATHARWVRESGTAQSTAQRS
jgi:hypothetical protein